MNQEYIDKFAEASKAMPFVGGCKDGEIRPAKNTTPEVEHEGFRFTYQVVTVDDGNDGFKFIAISSCNQSEL